MLDTLLTALARLSQRTAPFFVLVVVVLSTLPGTWRPHTMASGDLEHFVAYAGTAGALLLALGRRRLPVVVAALVGLAGALEIAQTWIPGRSVGIDNWLASSAGALIGALVALPILRRLAIAEERQRAAEAHRGGSRDERIR